MSVFAGIDYSLTSPAICVGNISSELEFSSVFCYFRSNLSRFDSFKDGNIYGQNHKAFVCDQDRYDDIAEWALNILEKHKVARVCLEGYSFGSTGRVFNIAENTAILKDRMWDMEIDFDVVAPSSIKKFATGKGNANKDQMYSVFCEENPNVDLMGLLTPRASKVISPVSDVVDSYYMLKYAFDLKQQG